MSLNSPVLLYIDLMMTSVFRRKVDEIFALLGYYAAYSDKHQRFGKIFCSHFRGSRNPRRDFILPIGCPETSVTNYHYILRNRTEERRFPIMMNFIRNLLQR